MVLVLLLATTLGAVDYDAAQARSSALEAAGDVAEAARVLEPLAEAYPQDFTLFLRLGWLYFSAGDYARADAAYRRAAELSDGAPEAQLGLGWTALRQGRRAAAVRAFETVLAASADDPRAIEGLALARKAPVRLAFSASGTVHQHPDHPDLTSGGSGTISAGLAFAAWRVGGAYRFLTITGPGQGQGARATVDYPQHEVYAWLGLEGAHLGLTARYALVRDTSGIFGSVHAGGATLRASWLGDAFLDGNVTRYADLTVVRLAPSWRFKPIDLFFLEPGVAVQLVEGERTSSGRLTVGLEGSVGALWVGAKTGREIRPTSLPLLEVYNLLSDVRYGLWAGAQVKIAGGLHLFGAWAMNGLATDRDGVETDSQHHLFTAGVARW